MVSKNIVGLYAKDFMKLLNAIKASMETEKEKWGELSGFLFENFFQLLEEK